MNVDPKIYELLAQFRKDCEAAVEELLYEVKVKKTVSGLCINTADFSVLAVGFKIEEGGDKTLVCDIEEGKCQQAEQLICEKLRALDPNPYEDYYIEVNTQW